MNTVVKAQAELPNKGHSCDTHMTCMSIQEEEEMDEPFAFLYDSNQNVPGTDCSVLHSYSSQ